MKTIIFVAKLVWTSLMLALGSGGLWLSYMFLGTVFYWNKIEFIGEEVKTLISILIISSISIYLIIQGGKSLIKILRKLREEDEDT